MQELHSLRAKLADLEREFRVADTKAGTMKIACNGAYGKLGSPYSVLYAPNLMIQVTMTGQLALLMLIEDIELRGFRVISANTDGVVTMVPRERRDDFEAIIWDWEAATGFSTEETEYRAVHSRDVNSYIAITTDGKVKLKGAFTPAGPGQAGAAGMKKNPTCEISTDAAVAWLKDGTPIEETIRGCTDIRRFVAVRRVTGGAEKDGEYIGKAIRYYYARGESGFINYVSNGNTVPRSQGAKPCMELPDELPDDIDYDWYIREAYAVLEDVGAPLPDPRLAGRTGTMLARLESQKTVHIVALPSGVALCGKGRASLREEWIDYKPAAAAEFRMCGKCKREDAL